MRPLRLIYLDSAVIATILADGTAKFSKAYGVHLAGNESRVREIARHAAEFSQKKSPAFPWGGYLAADTDSGDVIGSCVFKGAPSKDGDAELAFYTFPMYEKRGYATAMVAALKELAFFRKDVVRLLAHTPPKRGPWTRVLEKHGFKHETITYDTDDGVVWRWELTKRS